MKLAALLLAWSASVAAESVPAPGPVDSRIRAVDYNAQDVVHLQAYLGYALELELEPGERVVNVAAGDTAALDIGVEGSRVLLKPRQPVAGMNLTVLTDRRAYHFDYHAARAAGEPPRQELTYALRFTFPQPAVAPPAAPAPRNLAYWYCGDASLRPLEAFDDGVQTHLHFGRGVVLPAVFAAEEDGSESMVNSHLDGDWLVIHRLARRFVLRTGSLVGCVEDRAQTGHGSRLIPPANANAAQASRGGAR
jgi:type IV secretion system protein VirB9